LRTATRKLPLRLDAQHRNRIIKFLHQRVATLDNRRAIGQALSGAELGELWRYRVGDYRMIVKMQDMRRVVLVVAVGHRKEIYR
jgi:mRNA interferase RelE/StbE